MWTNLYFGFILIGFMLATALSMEARCSDPVEVGSGEDKTLKYHYVQSTGFCVPFFYKGMEGNENRFDSDEKCMEACSSKHNDLYPAGDEVCALPVNHGSCFAMLLMYYYSVEERTCRIFHYGGCQGNGNRFETREQCLRMCQAKSGRLLGEAMEEPNPDVSTVDTGLIIGILGGCVFAAAIISAIVLLVVQRKGDKTHRKKEPTSHIEMT